MKSDDVIARLVADLEPVSPLPLPGVRTRRWSLFALLCVGLAVLVLGVRFDLAQAVLNVSLPAHLTLLLMASVGSAGAALALAMPGERLATWLRVAPVAAVVSWGAWLSADLVAAVAADPGRSWLVAAGWGCVAKVLAVGVVPGMALLWMIGRGAPTDLRRAAGCAALAATGLGAFGAELTCPDTRPMHLLVWHAATVFVLPLVAALAGRPLVRAAMRRGAP